MDKKLYTGPGTGATVLGSTMQTRRFHQTEAFPAVNGRSLRPTAAAPAGPKTWRYGRLLCHYPVAFPWCPGI